MPDYQVFDDLEMGVQIIAPDMTYAYLNKQLGREVGQEPAVLVGQRMTDAFPGIDATDIYGAIVRCLETGAPSTFVNEFTFADGRITYYELELHPVAGGVLVFSRDITETRRGEILLRETAKNQEHFAHIAAHDMREPVRRMQILAEELVLDHAEALPAEAAGMCQQLLAQSQALMQLINDFRSLSGIAGSGAGARAPVSMQEVFGSVEASLQERFAAAGMALRLPSADLVVSAFPSMVGILVRNLLDNALKHGHGEVVVAFGLPGRPAAVAITNPTSLEPLGSDPFLPFVGRDRARHTGLGLAIAKRVAAHHDGQIWAEHDGDRFTVQFILEAGARALQI